MTLFRRENASFRLFLVPSQTTLVSWHQEETLSVCTEHREWNGGRGSAGWYLESYCTTWNTAVSFLLHTLKPFVAVESISALLFQDCLFNKVNVLLDCISLFCFDLKSLILNSLVHQKERHECESFVFLVNRHWVNLR